MNENKQGNREVPPGNIIVWIRRKNWNFSPESILTQTEIIIFNCVCCLLQANHVTQMCTNMEGIYSVTSRENDLPD